MAYSDVKLLVLTAIPERHKSQPTGFSGLREATIAPTVASITIVELPSHQSKTWVPGWERIRARRRRLSAVSATESAHSDQASQEAVRGVIPPIPLPRSLAPSITTPLYSATVCQALRQPLRGGVVCELRRTPFIGCWVPTQNALVRVKEFAP